MQPRKRGSALGVLAYLLVPGERRRRAATHFRRAGFEAVKGVGALMQPERLPEGDAVQSRRQRIEIE
jgi:hypothetical protein